MTETDDGDDCLHCELANAVQDAVMDYYDLKEDDEFNLAPVLDALSEVLADLIITAGVPLGEREKVIAQVERVIREKIAIVGEVDAAAFRSAPH